MTKGVAKDKSDIQLTGRDTHLSDRIKLDGIYETSGDYPPVYFLPDGIIVFGDKTGVYRLMGNLIIANVYKRPADILSGWDMNTLRFKIIGPEEIRLYDNTTHWSASTEFMILREPKTYRFVQTNEKPRIDPIIYEQKWLWEREEDWQRWMDEHAPGKGR